MTPKELATELRRRGCRVVVEDGAVAIRSPDDRARKWVLSVWPVLRECREDVLAALMPSADPTICRECLATVYDPAAVALTCPMVGLKGRGRCPLKDPGGY